MSYENPHLQAIAATIPKECFASRELDMTNEADAACVLGQFGGEEQMRERYPDLHSLFLRTKEQNAEKNDSNVGFINKAKILAVGYDKSSGTAFSMGTMNLTAPARRLYLTLDIYVQDKLVAHNAKFFSGSVDAEIEIQSEKMDPLPDGQLYTANIQATWEPEKSGMLRSMVATASMTGSADAPVKNFSITHPRHLHSPEFGPIIVGYARRVSNMDYNYSESRDQKTRNEKVFLDVEGQLDLADGYHVTSVENAGAALSCKGFGDILYLGSVKYGSNPSASGVVFYPLNNAASIGWKLEKEWKNEIPDSVKFGNRTQDFEFAFSYRCKEDTSPHDVLVTSKGTDLVLSQPYVESISKIQLYWGCLAKGTKITLSDGTAKNVEDIKTGDKLMNPSGGEVTVKELVTGIDTTVYVVRMENGKEVRTTESHPLGTGNGFTTPLKLWSQSNLMTESGPSGVLYCYPESYNGSVYSIELESGDSFYANGIVSGSNSVMGNLLSAEADESAKLRTDESVLDEIRRLEEDFRKELI